MLFLSILLFSHFGVYFNKRLLLYVSEQIYQVRVRVRELMGLRRATLWLWACVSSAGFQQSFYNQQFY